MLESEFTHKYGLDLGNIDNRIEISFCVKIEF